MQRINLESESRWVYSYFLKYKLTAIVNYLNSNIISMALCNSIYFLDIKERIVVSMDSNYTKHVKFVKCNKICKTMTIHLINLNKLNKTSNYRSVFPTYSLVCQYGNKYILCNIFMLKMMKVQMKRDRIIIEYIGMSSIHILVLGPRDCRITN